MIVERRETVAFHEVGLQRNAKSFRYTVSVFKLFIFTVVKTKKSCFEQNDEWFRFDLILFKLHEVSCVDSQENH